MCLSDARSALRSRISPTPSLSATRSRGIMSPCRSTGKRTRLAAPMPSSGKTGSRIARRRSRSTRCQRSITRMSDHKEQIARFEFKYLLDSVTAFRVRDFIESVGLSHDTNMSENPYTVTSLYFDSFGLDDYYDKAGGFLSRKKVRIRAYESALHRDQLDLYFEIKNKHDMFVSKDRAVVSKKEWGKIVEGNFKGLFPLFDYYVFREGRVPTVIVRYEREAFDTWFYGRVRLTFDRHI